MQVKDLTVDEFRTLIRETVEDVLQEVFDPDQGKSVKGDVKAELLYMQERRLASHQTVSAEEALQELGLN